jgi:hypothetical protein
MLVKSMLVLLCVKMNGECITVQLNMVLLIVNVTSTFLTVKVLGTVTILLNKSLLL